jgi:hypothetical protein
MHLGSVILEVTHFCEAELGGVVLGLQITKR